MGVHLSKIRILERFDLFALYTLRTREVIVWRKINQGRVAIRT